MSCRLLLADDHEIVRKNLREIIEFKTDCVIVAEAIDGLQAVRLAKEHAGTGRIGCGPPDSHGEPQTKILILTTHDATP